MIPGMDMQQIMAKAKELQQNLAKQKEEAANKTVEATVGGGMVQVVFNGNMELMKIEIDKEVIDRDDKETLEDLVRAAVNEGLRQAKAIQSTGMGDLLGGMDLDALKNFGL